MSTTFLILLLFLCVIIIIGLGLGFYFFQGKSEETVPTITVDDVSVESETPSGNTEMYTYDELSKDVKINVTWSNGPDFDDVTNLYFTRTKGSVTDKKEADARGRTSNSTGNKIVYIQKAGEDMRGQHTIKVTYKLRGQTQEKVLTSFVANVSEDQLTLAKDSLKSVVVSYSPATVPFSSDVETQKTMVTLNPEPSGFGPLYFIPSGANNAIKIKRMSDGKFLKHDASFQASGDTFYVQSAADNRNRISTTDTDEGKLLTTVGPSLKKYTDMNPEERTKSLFTFTFSPAIVTTCIGGSVCATTLTSTSGRCAAVTQSDGNYAVYESGNAIWDAKTAGQGTGPYRTTMQSDGNLVLYDSTDTALWDSKTYGRGTGPYRAVMQDDCNLVIYDSGDQATWSSKGGSGGSVKSTTADDWGEGNSVYLDRHDVDCGDDGLMQFRLGRPSATQINYSYTCKEGIDSPGTDKNSGANDWGEGSSVYLDRHNVDCGNKPIARFRLVRPADDKIQYDYRCSNKEATGSCRDVNTELNDEGEGNSVYLDRHDVKCNPDEVITQFKLNRDGQGKFRYGYKCCKM